MDGATEVSGLHFRWTDTKTIDSRELQPLLVTKGRGSFYGIRSAIGKLPLIPRPAAVPFDPMNLQRDVVRMRARYREAGFRDADVRYDVVRDDTKNLLDVTFVISEGTPLILRDVAVVARDSLFALPVPEGEHGSWKKEMDRWDRLEDRRFDLLRTNRYRARTETWWRDRGFPFARVEGALAADSTGEDRDLILRVAPGRTAVFRPIEVEGTRNIKATTVAKRVSFREGDPYSEKKIEESRRDIGELGIVRVAILETPAPAPADSLSALPGTPPADIPLRVRITEAEPRLVSGQLGYGTDAGASSEVRWTHRNFVGGARTFTVSGVAQTGWWAVVENPDRLYRASVSVTQPSFLARRMSGVVSPFIEKRDNVTDNSMQIGLNTTLIYRLGGLKSVALDYQVARRRIYEYTLDDFAAGDVDLLTLQQFRAQGLLDSLGTELWSSAFTLSGSLGSVDNPANPRRGLVLRPAIQLTAPPSLASTNYSRLDVGVHGYAALPKRTTLAARVSAGRIYPFGKSVPASGDDPSVKFLQLRDVLFTAGGTDDVRGWGDRLLGPKFPDVRGVSEADTIRLVADDFVPLGGFERLSWSLELRVPFPGARSTWGWHAFLDAGRVRTSDTRFETVAGAAPGGESWFYGTGLGLDLGTPVGPIKLDMGYKLNPSIADLVDSGDLFQALIDGTPLESLEKKNSRRWQFHLAFGTSF